MAYVSALFDLFSGIPGDPVVRPFVEAFVCGMSVDFAKGSESCLDAQPGLEFEIWPTDIDLLNIQYIYIHTYIHRHIHIEHVLFKWFKKKHDPHDAFSGFICTPFNTRVQRNANRDNEG